MQIPTVDLTGPGHYLTIGWLSISVGNLIVVGITAMLFLGALVLPFPGSREM
jgi:hypothetical protein